MGVTATFFMGRQANHATAAISRQNRTFPTPLLKIIYLDDDLAAIDKPAGLLVHPTGLDAHETRNAMALLRNQLGAHVWPLHRLDKGTSGVLLFARHEAAAAAGAHRLKRARCASVTWRWCAAGQTTRARSATRWHATPSCLPPGQQRLDAVTHWERLRTFEWDFSVDGRHPTSRYALVAVEPLTGRRHQIRRHFKHIAHPLVGDTTHGKGQHNRAVAAWLGLDRLWLHAQWIELPGAHARRHRAAHRGTARPRMGATQPAALNTALGSLKPVRPGPVPVAPCR
jgi:tRNA pseudouridine65 synthase